MSEFAEGKSGLATRRDNSALLTVIREIVAERVGTLTPASVRSVRTS